MVRGHFSDAFGVHINDRRVDYDYADAGGNQNEIYALQQKKTGQDANPKEEKRQDANLPTHYRNTTRTNIAPVNLPFVRPQRNHLACLLSFHDFSPLF